MRASDWERDIAIRVVEMLINRGMAKEVYETEGVLRCGLWDWLDDKGLFNEGINYADGATKAVIFHEDLDSYVIKFRLPCESADKDYCARELANYMATEEAGLEYYFAATEYLCEREGIVFYLQEQVICDEGVDSEMHSALQCQYEESGTPYDAENLWEEVEDMDSCDRVDLLYGNAKLTNFVWERHINDLHCGNFGLAGDHYVIIDFSGFGLAALLG